jgi:hypothetical protein
MNANPARNLKSHSAPPPEGLAPSPALLSRRLIRVTYGVGPAALKKLGVPAYRLGHKTVLFKARDVETALEKCRE